MPERDERSGIAAPAWFWRAQLTGWSLYAVAMIFSRLGVAPLSFMIVQKGALALTGMLTTLPMRTLYRRITSNAPSLPVVIASTVVASYAFSLIWTLAANAASWHLARTMLGREIQITSLAQLFDGAVYNAFTLLAWSLLYLGITQFREISRERERALRAEAEAQAARLRALRYQLNPHLLFNTLNAISTLIVEQRGADATRMLSRLSDFLRMTLEGSDASEVPLEEELAFVQRYLEIERVRFGDRLGVRLDVAPAARCALVPSMLLQPLVENAVKHAVSTVEQGATITLAAKRDERRLRIVVSDNGPGMSPVGGTGIGLTNVRERLQALHGSDHRFAVETAVGGGVRVTIEIPFRQAPAT